MTTPELRSMTLDAILDWFVALSKAQDDASLADDIDGYNRLYWEIKAVDAELHARGTEARLALARLYDYQHMQVRLNAATYTLGILPKEARALLETISHSRHGPQDLDAGMRLINLDRGIFKPD